MTSRGMKFGLIATAVVLAIVGIVCAILFTGKDEVYEAKHCSFKMSNQELIIQNRNSILLTGQLGQDLMSVYDVTKCEDDIECYTWEDKVKLTINSTRINQQITCSRINWEVLNPMAPDLIDCFDLGHAHWYGSAEMYYQYWPIERWNKSMKMYVSGDMYADAQDWGSVMEPYWLSSNGLAIWFDKDSPLHVSINYNNDGKICFKSSYDDSYYQRPSERLPVMVYDICSGNTIKDIHLYMAYEYLKRPSGIPDERMISLPIWSTWARYKIFINDSVILKYAQEIIDNGFNNSQLEIDDGYQSKYGDFEFDPQKFPNPADTVSELRKLGFRVTMWVMPFANVNSDAYTEGKRLGYWVKKQGSDDPGLVTWWNGIGGLLDVTNSDACDWYTQRLVEIRNLYGIDSFKFDAGETNYLPKNYKTSRSLYNPGYYTTLHAEMAAKFGNQIEVRAAYGNQELATFVRMMDKDSKWGDDNGLKTIIPTALTFSILGYPFILPDMIGGNAYNGGFHGQDKPERELYIRWLEVTAFLPSMQFSISPWQYDDEVVSISRRWVEFHTSDIAPLIIELAKNATKSGSPIIRPLWWLDPNNENALTIDDEFLVGDKILVAPILTKGAVSRDIFLPTGTWMDELNKISVEGSQWLRNVSVPLAEVAYFKRIE